MGINECRLSGTGRPSSSFFIVHDNITIRRIPFNGAGGSTPSARWLLPISCVVLLFLSLSCSVSDRASRGQPYEPKLLSEQGLPFFQFQAYPRSGPTPGAEISLGVSTTSLVFVRAGELFECLIELSCRVLDARSGKLVVEDTWPDTIRVRGYQQTQSRQTRYINRFLAFSPGEYVVEMVLTDRNSGKSATRIRRIAIVGSAGSAAAAGEIQLMHHLNPGSTVPLLSPYLEKQTDTIECSSEVINLHPGDSLVCTITIRRLERDSTLPSVPYALPAGESSIRHDGIHLENPHQVLCDTVAFTYPETSQITWSFSASQEGAYLMEVSGFVFRSNSVEPIVEATRPVVIVARGFPRPKEPEQLISSVDYIMLDSDRDSLASKTTAADRQQWLGDFWRSLGKTEDAAANLVDRYYTRVEEANEYFSTFKEGWGTDRGMLYVILGPPLTVQTGLQGELWNYSPTEGDRLNSYYFRRVQLQGEFIAFEHYLLERQSYYDQPWFAAIDRWRRGSDY